MEGVEPLDQQAIRHELHRRMLTSGNCPQCHSHEVRWKEAVGEFPNSKHMLMYCHACGLAVQVQEQLDDVGRMTGSAVVGADGLHSSWANFKPSANNS